MLSVSSVLSHRESVDGGRIAVQVEGKVVRVRNVKVSSVFQPQKIIDVALIHSMRFCEIQ